MTKGVLHGATAAEIREIVRSELQNARIALANTSPAAKERGTDALPRLPEGSLDDSNKRKDVLGFLDALTAGAIALGVTRFVELVYDATKTSSANNVHVDVGKTIAWATIPFVGALLIVFEDFRHARSLNSEYGLRLRPDDCTPRYWIECAIAVVSFLLISSSFANPVQLLFWLGCFYLLGWVWAMFLVREIRSFTSKGEYPANSQSLTYAKAKELTPWWRDDPALADRRIAFVVLSHLGCCLPLFVIVYFTYNLVHQIAVLHDSAVIGFSSSAEINAYFGEALQVGVAVAPVLIFLMMKVAHAISRAAWYQRSLLVAPKDAAKEAQK